MHTFSCCRSHPFCYSSSCTSWWCKTSTSALSWARGPVDNHQRAATEEPMLFYFTLHAHRSRATRAHHHLVLELQQTLTQVLLSRGHKALMNMTENIKSEMKYFWLGEKKKSYLSEAFWSLHNSINRPFVVYKRKPFLISPDVLSSIIHTQQVRQHSIFMFMPVQYQTQKQCDQNWDLKKNLLLFLF